MIVGKGGQGWIIAKTLGDRAKRGLPQSQEAKRPRDRQAYLERVLHDIDSGRSTTRSAGVVSSSKSIFLIVRRLGDVGAQFLIIHCETEEGDKRCGVGLE